MTFDSDMALMITLMNILGMVVYFLTTIFLYMVYRKKYIKQWGYFWLFLILAYFSVFLVIQFDLAFVGIFFSGFLLIALIFLHQSIYLYFDRLTSSKTRYYHLLMGLALLVSLFFAEQLLIYQILTFFVIGCYFLKISFLLFKTDVQIYKLVGLLFAMQGLNNITYPFLIQFNWYFTISVIINGFIGMLLGLALFGLHIYEEKEKGNSIYKKLLYMSYRDELTSLHNRAYYNERLEAFESNKTFPLTMVVADLDTLKLVNDTHGHYYGDLILKKTATSFINIKEKEDVLVRFGGDEFILIKPNKTISMVEAIIKTEIVDFLSKEKVKNIPITVSYGIAERINQDEPLQAVFNRAEQSMYKMKKSTTTN